MSKRFIIIGKMLKNNTLSAKGIDRRQDMVWEITMDSKENNNKIDNPLPEPVEGRRVEMEFPITDTGDGKWPPLSDTTDLENFDDRRDVMDDDFDVHISDTDDFDF